MLTFEVTRNGNTVIRNKNNDVVGLIRDLCFFTGKPQVDRYRIIKTVSVAEGMSKGEVLGHAKTLETAMLKASRMPAMQNLQ